MCVVCLGVNVWIRCLVRISNNLTTYDMNQYLTIDCYCFVTQVRLGNRTAICPQPLTEPQYAEKRYLPTTKLDDVNGFQC